MKYFQKIELFLVRTGYLTKGEAPKDALESGVAAIAQLANVIKDLEAPRSVANLTILDTIPDSAPATRTRDLTTIAIPTLASSTLAARPSSPSSTTGLTDLQSRGYYTRARAHAERTLSGSISASAGQMGPEWVTREPPKYTYARRSRLSAPLTQPRPLVQSRLPFSHQKIIPRMRRRGNPL